MIVFLRIISNVLTSPMYLNIDDKHMLLIIKQTFTEAKNQTNQKTMNRIASSTKVKFSGQGEKGLTQATHRTVVTRRCTPLLQNHGTPALLNVHVVASTAPKYATMHIGNSLSGPLSMALSFGTHEHSELTSETLLM